jgi:hypothetical protein
VSEADREFLATLTNAAFENDGHRTKFVPALSAIASVAQDVRVAAANAFAAQSVASASLAAQMALGTAANGVGNEPMDLPRMSMLNGEAFRQWDMAAGLIVNTQDATYQIVEHDSAKLLLCTSGTRTWTLPAGTDVWIGWQARLRNRSGNNLTLARTGSDTINGAGSNLTIATGSAILTIVCTGAAAFEVA